MVRIISTAQLGVYHNRLILIRTINPEKRSPRACLEVGDQFMHANHNLPVPGQRNRSQLGPRVFRDRLHQPQRQSTDNRCESVRSLKSRMVLHLFDDIEGLIGSDRSSSFLVLQPHEVKPGCHGVTNLVVSANDPEGSHPTASTIGGSYMPTICPIKGPESL